MYECDKNQMPYCNVKVSKNQMSWNFGPFIEHGPHGINSTILTFKSENNNYFRGMYKICNKIISFDMQKKVKCKTSHGENEEKGEFGSPWSESLRFKCDTPIMFRPNKFW